jgi:hypothetical protein
MQLLVVNVNVCAIKKLNECAYLHVYLPSRWAQKKRMRMTRQKLNVLWPIEIGLHEN